MDEGLLTEEKLRNSYLNLKKASDQIKKDYNIHIKLLIYYLIKKGGLLTLSFPFQIFEYVSIFLYVEKDIFYKK